VLGWRRAARATCLGHLQGPSASLAMRAGILVTVLLEPTAGRREEFPGGPKKRSRNRGFHEAGKFPLDCTW